MTALEKTADIDTPIERTNGVLLVTLKVHFGFSQSPKHINGSHAVIYHNETVPIHWAWCQYIVENQLRSAAKKQQKHIGPLLSSPFIDSFILSYLLKECSLEKAGSSEHQLPPLQAACDVTWAVWSPWEKTLMHTGNNQGNTGRVQRNANIFSECLKNNTTRMHTNIAKCYLHIHTHRTQI